jgi:hypothetical protein
MMSLIFCRCLGLSFWKSFIAIAITSAISSGLHPTPAIIEYHLLIIGITGFYMNKSEHFFSLMG